MAPVALDLTPRPPVAGSTVKVTYSGAPAGENNWVAVALKAAPDSEYLDTQTAKGASSAVDLNLPDDTSEYELRYYLSNPDGSSRVIGRSTPFTPVHVAASVSGPASAVAGSQITVKWTGPSNPSDYVTVVKKGAPEGSYLDYKYTRDGNPLTLTVPLEAGDFELRYSSDAGARTLASAPITLKPGSYSLTAPATATSGSTLSVNWSGPNNGGEYVTVVRKDAPVGTYTTYFYTRDGNPGKLKLPTEPGEYELRYSTERSSPNPTLYSLPLTIAAPSGAAAYSLQAPASVTGGAQVQVKWGGPNNSGDYVTVVKAGDPVGTYTQYFYTRDGNPGTLKMPFAPGDYELRYSTGCISLSWDTVV